MNENDLAEDETEQLREIPEEAQLKMFVTSVGYAGVIGGIATVASAAQLLFPNASPLMILPVTLIPGAITYGTIIWWGRNAKDPVGGERIEVPRWRTMLAGLVLVIVALSLFGPHYNPYVQYYLHCFDPYETLLFGGLFLAVMAVLLSWFVRDVNSNSRPN